MLKWNAALNVLGAMHCPRQMFHLLPRFFGLSDEYIGQVYEMFFFLKYHGGWSFTEAYNLPVKIRNWFAKRLLKQIEDERSQQEKSRKR